MPVVVVTARQLRFIAIDPKKDCFTSPDEYRVKGFLTP
jgi:hypothetical protein